MRTALYKPVVSLVLLTGLAGCDKVFDLTPYEAEPPENMRGLNEVHAAAIRTIKIEEGGPLTFALTSDPHYHYGDLSDIVAHINGDPTIAFTMVPGDLTDQGLLGEFEAFTRIMQGLSRPWLAVIGNHDHLGNGRVIFENTFGRRNDIVDVAGYRFILFDDVVWESGMAPDIEWLRSALEEASGRIPIVIAHIPPFNDQLAGVYEQSLRELTATNGVSLFIHGHLNQFNDHEPYGDGVRYLCVPWPERRSYVKVILEGGTVNIEQVHL